MATNINNNTHLLRSPSSSIATSTSTATSSSNVTNGLSYSSSTVVVNGPLPSIHAISSLTDLGMITSLLQDAQLHERALSQELERFLKGRDQLEVRLEVIEMLPTKLKPLYSKGKELAETIETTCGLAETVSKKVKELDSTRDRVKETIKKVMDIIDIKNCIDGVKKAMQSEDFETAAGHVRRYRKYLDLDSAVLEETSARQLRSAEERLKDLVREKLELALAEDNQENLIRFCKLYTPLGMEEEGLARYGDYIRKVAKIHYDSASKQLNSGLSSAATTNGGGAGGGGGSKAGAAERVCVDVITKLFEGMAGILEDQQPIAEEHFGEESPLFVITVLQSRCDVHANDLFSKIFSHFQLSKIVNEVNSIRSGANMKEHRDPRSISGILDMLATLSQRIELYERFVRKKAQTIQEGLKSKSMGTGTSTAPTKFQFNENSLFNNSQLTRIKQEMMSQYILLEEYFMVESVHKAVRMDQDTGDGLTSSIVEHVFYVLQKSTRRAMSSANVTGVCAIINLLNNCLNLDYKEVLQTMLSDKAAEAMASGNPDQKPTYMVVLNNLEVSSDFILKLKAELEAECDRVFGPSERDKVKTCLLDLLQTSKTFRQVLQGNLEQVGTTVMPRLRPLMDLFQNVNYVLTENTFAENEINDPFVEKFLSGLDSVLLSFRPSLTETNFDALLHIIVQQHIATRFEKALLQKKFNQLGGLQFDKDLRVLMTYFSNNSQRTVRGEFARLTQMASLLNLEKVSEVLEYWGHGNKSGHMTWRLSPAEVRKVLSRRIDFRPDEIAALVL